MTATASATAVSPAPVCSSPLGTDTASTSDKASSSEIAGGMWKLAARPVAAPSSSTITTTSPNQLRHQTPAPPASARQPIGSSTKTTYHLRNKEKSRATNCCKIPNSGITGQAHPFVRLQHTAREMAHLVL